MPDRAVKPASVHLTVLPETNATWKDERLGEKWKQIFEIRSEITKALEEARANKRVGHSLDAAVALYAEDDLYTEIAAFTDDLRSVCIISKLSLFKKAESQDTVENTDIEGLSIHVEPASDDKCERCWMRDPTVGSGTEHPTICNRCQTALDQMDI